MKYFFDNCISFHFASALHELGVDATALRERFDQSVDDEVFLPLIGDHDVLLSRDPKQLRRIHELIALRASGVTAIYLENFWGKMTFWPQAAWLVRHWPMIDEFSIKDGKSGKTFMLSATCKFTEVRWRRR